MGLFKEFRKAHKEISQNLEDAKISVPQLIAFTAEERPVAVLVDITPTGMVPTDRTEYTFKVLQACIVSMRKMPTFQRFAELMRIKDTLEKVNMTFGDSLVVIEINHQHWVLLTPEQYVEINEGGDA